MDDKRTYNRAEISRILSETLERQKKQPEKNPTGLTEAELFQIAEEAGIDRKALQETLLNFKAEPEINKPGGLMGSSKIHHIQMIPGVINDELWEEIKIELKGALGGAGIARKSGKAYEMEYVVDEMGFKSLSLIPKKDTTRFEYTEDWPALKILITIISGIVGAGITLVALKDIGLSKSLTVFLAPLGGILGAGLGLGFLGILFKAQKKKLSKIIETISDKLKQQNQPVIEIEEDLYSSENESSSDMSSGLKN